MTLARLMDAAIFLLLAAALWSLDTVAGAGTNPLEIVRYGIICGLEGTIILLAVIEAMRRPLSLRLTAGGALLVAFLAYTAVSVFWSAGGTQSVLKDVLLITSMATALAIAAVRPPRVIVQSAVIACAVVIVLGVLAVIFAPGVGIETGWGLEGKWRGISAQKNTFGGFVALNLVYAAIQLIVPPPAGRRRGPVLLTLLWIGFLGYCLIMSGSRGAQLATVLGLSAVAFTRLSRRHQNLVLFATGLLVLPLAALAAISFSVDATHLSIAGLTFDTSSRTLIWAYGLQNLGGRELFGFGPSGFWTPERLQIFLANNGWALDNFHSGYVTVLMEGGIVGSVVLLAALAGCFSWLRRQATGGDRYAVFTFAFFAISVAENLVENIFGRSTDFLFILFLLLMLASNTVAAPLVASARRLPGDDSLLEGQHA
jgi:O-antigen ligase